MAHLWHYSWGSTTYLNEDLATHYVLVTRPTCYHYYLPPPRANTYTNTFSPSRYQLAFPFKPTADSVTTLDSNCTSRSCLIELTRSRNWCHLTHWSWETMRQNASHTPPFSSPTCLLFSSLWFICPFLWFAMLLPMNYQIHSSLLSPSLGFSALSCQCHFLLHSFQRRDRNVVIKNRI